MIEREINSVEELIIALGIDLESYSGSTWYRGQADSDWPLLPGYMRLTSSISERTLLAKFRQSAALLIDTAPKDSFDWLFLMQHFGVPTRLLDWSESPLVGLYFAVEGYALHTDSDAALWLLRPAELNKNAGIRSKEEADYIPSFEDDELKGYSVDSVYNNRVRDLFPVATIATGNNARIQAQLGVFTIHHSEKYL